MRKTSIFILFSLLNLTGYTQTKIDEINLLILTQNYQEALTQNSKHIEENPGNAYAFYQQALIYKQLYRFTEALNAIQQAIAFDEGNVDYLSEYGSLLLKKDKDDAAAVIFEKVLQKDSNQVYSGISLANYYLKRKKYEEANDILHHLYRKDTINGYFARNLGLCSIRLLDKVNSIKWLSRAIQLDSTDIKAYGYLALVYTSLEMFDLAIENLNTATRMDPGNKALYIKLGDIHVMRNHNFQAIPAYLKAYELDSNDELLAKSLGMSYFKVKKNDQALFYLDQAYKSNLADLQVCQHLAYIYAEKKQFDASLLFFNEALNLLKPDNGTRFSIKEDMAKNYYEMNEYEKAIEIFNEALDLNLSDEYWVGYKKNKLIIDIAAIYHEKLNNKLKAIEYYQKVLEPEIAINKDYYKYAQNQITKLKEELFFEGE